MKKDKVLLDVFEKLIPLYEEAIFIGDDSSVNFKDFLYARELDMGLCWAAEAVFGICIYEKMEALLERVCICDYPQYLFGDGNEAVVEQSLKPRLEFMKKYING